MKRPTVRPAAVLAVLCLCTFAVNIDTTIVNVTLPTLVRELGATTRELQWIVDAYNLTFAAFVLAAGVLGDRFGRRRTLLLGLVVYGVANVAAAVTQTPGELIVARLAMGLGAAIIFPTTLSIIANVYSERGPRAQAIGIWGATTGLAVALGPIAGGALLEAFSWESTFLAKVPVAVVALGLVAWLVPDSRDASRPALDVPGLLLSALALGALVFTIIEAPEVGWSAPRTLGGFALATGLLAAFLLHERRTADPMLDLRLFGDARFSAASASITVAFFALFGFIFLIVQYFQFLRGYGPLETGLRLIPVALSIGIASVVGTRLVVRLGNKAVVTAGLVSLTAAYVWTSGVDTGTSYLEIAGQMVLLGGGMGLTSAPATESIMGAVPMDKAGLGSAINDTTRELGGTLGVAVIGSVYASLYVDAFAGREVPEPARESVGGALIAADRLPGEAGAALARLADTGFFDGLQAGCLVAAGLCAVGAAFTAVALPARPAESPPEPEPQSRPAARAAASAASS